MADETAENGDGVEKSDGADSGGSETFYIPDTRRAVELEPDVVTNLHRLAGLMERMQLSEYLAMMTRPGKVLYTNFIAGLARGLGFGLGMTVLLGLALYAIGMMVDLPLIGEYVAKVVRIVQEEVGSAPKF